MSRQNHTTQTDTDRQSNLPHEILLSIATQCDRATLVNLSKTCRAHYIVSSGVRYSMMILTRPHQIRPWARNMVRFSHFGSLVRVLYFPVVIEMPVDELLVKEVVTALRLCVNVVELRPPTMLGANALQSMPFKLQVLHGPMSHMDKSEVFQFLASQPSIRCWFQPRSQLFFHSDEDLSPKPILPSLASLSIFPREGTLRVSLPALRRLRISQQRDWRMTLPSYSISSTVSNLKAFPDRHRLTHLHIDYEYSERFASNFQQALAPMINLKYLRVFFVHWDPKYDLSTITGYFHALVNLEVLVLDLNAPRAEHKQAIILLHSYLQRLHTVQFNALFCIAYAIRADGLHRSATLVRNDAWWDGA